MIESLARSGGRWPEPWRHGSSAVGHYLRDNLFRPRARLHGADGRWPVKGAE